MQIILGTELKSNPCVFKMGLATAVARPLINFQVLVSAKIILIKKAQEAGGRMTTWQSVIAAMFGQINISRGWRSAPQCAVPLLFKD